ncbi:MAG: hypothetical protein ACREUD_03275 [Gammaproteobacteria bacterium]
MLEVERLAARRIVHCRDCSHYLPSPPIDRASGAIWRLRERPNRARQPAAHLSLHRLVLRWLDIQ